jgi:hypothetical protein
MNNFIWFFGNESINYTSEDFQIIFINISPLEHIFFKKKIELKLKRISIYIHNLRLPQNKRITCIENKTSIAVKDPLKGRIT